MAPLIGFLINALIPVAVSEVQKKLQREKSMSEPAVTKTQAAVPALQAVAAGAVVSKTAWFSLALMLLGFLEQNQQILSSFVPPDKMGLVLAGIGAITFFLRGVTTTSLVEKSDPKI